MRYCIPAFEMHGFGRTLNNFDARYRVADFKVARPSISKGTPFFFQSHIATTFKDFSRTFQGPHSSFMDHLTGM